MENYLGEIRVFPYSIVPAGWLPCEGQILQIRTYTALYSLIGTFYGGDGTVTFALPDLRSRAIVGLAAGNAQYSPVGTKNGVETVQLTATQAPNHTHYAAVSSQVSDAQLTNAVTPGSTPAVGSLTNEMINVYAVATQPTVTLNQGTIGNTGGAAHSNIMPYAALQVYICISGYYPARS